MMKIFLFKKRNTCFCFLFFFLFFLSFKVNAQQKLTDAEKSKIIFTGNHVSFEFAKLYAFKAHIEKETGERTMSSSTMPGGKIIALYHINFNPTYSLVIGGEAAIVGTNSIFAFGKNDFSPPLQQDISFSRRDTHALQLLINIPITFEKRFWIKNKRFVSVGAGLSVHFSLSADLDNQEFYVRNINDSAFPVANINTEANNNAKPWVSFTLHAGHSWRLSNNNYLQLGAESDISFTRFMNGMYTFNVPDEAPSAGRYSSKGSYIAFYLRYTLTNGNYRLRRAYERAAAAPKN